MPQGVHLGAVICDVLVRLAHSGHLSAYLGTTLRGGFGRALREVACANPSVQCRDCLLGWRCAYGYLFDTPITPHASLMRRYTHAPHPFVLRVLPGQQRSAGPDQDLKMTLLLFGRAAEYFPYVVFALQRLGEMGLGAERVPFEVNSITTPEGQLIYEGGKRQPLLPVAPVVLTATVGEPRSGRLGLHFRTPTRLRVEGQVLRQPDFAAILSAGLRRLELLCRVHGAGTYDVDAAPLVAQAREVKLVRDATSWRDHVRYSQRQGQNMPLGGLTGWAEFAGEVGQFASLLRLAGLVHIGKDTAFGHGFCEIEEY
ncbi:MAG: CRISPR system precrRNA processing endoribonuclease RAMP protein Cas6 [Armatimonadetes bacterium]|nr:CRISPR system precrRNA processing endoribonuclease RAMP protein Cas6 [Armatimonadota bacterium]